MTDKTPEKNKAIDLDNTNSSNGSNDASSKSNTNKFPFPPCWDKKERMKVLMAPFRLRIVNPENYDSKVKFWQDIITQYCEFKGSPTLFKKNLQAFFVCGELTPHCLDTVLEEMMKAKKLRLRNDYEYDPGNTWTGWAVNNFVRNPLHWATHKMKSSIGLTNEGPTDSLEFIHLEVLKKFCKDLQTLVLDSQEGKLLHYDAFRKLVALCMNINEDCIQLCLLTLHSQKKIGLEYRNRGKEREIHLIKVPSSKNADIAITEVDHALHNLQMTRCDLMRQLEDLETDIRAVDDKVRLFMQEGKRQIAKTYLRKKHLYEQRQEKRAVALHNVESLLSSMEEAQSNGDILEAYKIGSKALQKTLNESGLKYDNVDEVISEMRETLETHKEVQDALSNANLSDVTIGSVCDEDDLERELQDILGESGRVTPIPKDQNTTTPNSVKTVHITDSELLAMLDQLEVADKTPSKSTVLG